MPASPRRRIGMISMTIPTTTTFTAILPALFPSPPLDMLPFRLELRCRPPGSLHHPNTDAEIVDITDGDAGIPGWTSRPSMRVLNVGQMRLPPSSRSTA